MSGYTLFSLDERKARKAHACVWCGQPIKVGEKYLDERSVYDHNIQRHRWHPECLDVQRDQAREYGEEEFAAGEGERPALGAVAA